MFVIYSLTSYSHLKQNVNQCLKKIMCYVYFMCYVYLELCVCCRPNQQLYFSCIFIILMNQKMGIHIIKSSYTSWLVYIEKNKFKIEKNTKILTGSAKYTENKWSKIILKNYQLFWDIKKLFIKRKNFDHCIKLYRIFNFTRTTSVKTWWRQ